MKRVARQCFDHLARAVRAAVVILAVVMLTVLTIQVGFRYALGLALSWSEELALACFSWSMLLAIALGVRDGIHVRMDLLVDQLPPLLRMGLEKLVMLSIAAGGVFIAWSGSNYVADAMGATSAAIGYPTAYLYACAPVCGALIALFALENLLLGPATQAAGLPD